MEINNREVAPMKSLSQQYTRDMLVRTLNSRGKSEVSVFGGPEATMEHILTSVKKLQVAFPQMSRDFWNLLTERIVKNNIAAERLEYCLTRVIDNFTYKTLTIADVIGSDLKCTIYTYAEMLNQCDKNNTTTSDYAPVYVGDNPKPFWVSKADKARFGIKERI